MDIAEFVKARLDEDEAAAQACEGPSPWKAAGHEHDSWIVTDATGEPLIYDEGTPTLNEAEHIARHDPARVLREVAAKRAILAVHQPLSAPWAAPGGPWCTACGDAEQYSGHDYPCATIRAIAAIWSDHLGYRAEWKP